ncbi:MAG: BamA/TamA family outer membrane protein [Chitinophagaceae bacterium]
MTTKQLNFSPTLRVHFIWMLCLLLASCSSTKRLKEGEYLLRSNTLRVRSDKTITNKGLLQDQLNLLVIQKTNTYWSGVFPFKLWRYNIRYRKFVNTQPGDLPKSIEKPVVYDSTLQIRTVANMKNFLFNQGYFNASIRDTVKFKGKKAYAYYYINTGISYLVNNVYVEADDSTVAAIVRSSLSQTKFQREKEYNKLLADEERARIITELQNRGYYRFSQDNVSFELDTVNKERLRDAENLFESAINFLTLQKRQKKLSLDVKIIVHNNGDSLSYAQYEMGKVIVFPDFIDRSTAFDSNLIRVTLDDISYRYRSYYVREGVLGRQIFFRPGERYSRTNHQLTITKLNELGIFQMINVYFIEDTTEHTKHLLNCYITLSPSDKVDASASLEVANATTYVLGNSIGLGYRNKNLFKGANLLSLNTTGGIEMSNSNNEGSKFLENVKLQSRNFGVNGTLTFPKFLSPYRPKWLDRRNLPKTQLMLGVNMLDRIDLFRLTNISSAFSYNWHQNRMITWDFSPAFANIVLPVIRPAFQGRLDSNEVLRNTYRRTFIEGEQLYFTFTDQEKKQNRNYYYLRLGVEEAGILMSGINKLQKTISNGPDFIFDQYVKFDLDARHYVNVRSSLLAMRFLAGIGSPYGDSKTLPYIKQYFVGGAYSIRGWRPRTLGPLAGSDTAGTSVDRTGDIKLEMNAEYRFDMIQLFSGTLKLNGAIFADAGNTWLARKSSTTLGGDFDISRLGHDIAVSTGAGLRVIVAEFFTVRLDAAFPVKNPYVAANNGWVIRYVDLGNSEWRQKNVVINLAIGMPF